MWRIPARDKRDITFLDYSPTIHSGAAHAIGLGHDIVSGCRATPWAFSTFPLALEPAIVTRLPRRLAAP